MRPIICFLLIGLISLQLPLQASVVTAHANPMPTNGMLEQAFAARSVAGFKDPIKSHKAPRPNIANLIAHHANVRLHATSFRKLFTGIIHASTASLALLAAFIHMDELQNLTPDALFGRVMILLIAILIVPPRLANFLQALVLASAHFTQGDFLEGWIYRYRAGQYLNTLPTAQAITIQELNNHIFRNKISPFGKNEFHSILRTDFIRHVNYPLGSFELISLRELIRHGPGVEWNEWLLYRLPYLLLSGALLMIYGTDADSLIAVLPLSILSAIHWSFAHKERDAHSDAPRALMSRFIFGIVHFYLSLSVVGIPVSIELHRLNNDLKEGRVPSTLGVRLLSVLPTTITQFLGRYKWTIRRQSTQLRFQPEVQVVARNLFPALPNFLHEIEDLTLQYENADTDQSRYEIYEAIQIKIKATLQYFENGRTLMAPASKANVKRLTVNDFRIAVVEHFTNKLGNLVLDPQTHMKNMNEQGQIVGLIKNVTNDLIDGTLPRLLRIEHLDKLPVYRTGDAVLIDLNSIPLPAIRLRLHQIAQAA